MVMGFFRKKMKLFLFITAFFFIGSIFLWYGVSYFTTPAKADFIVKINNRTISFQEFYDALYRQLDYMRDSSTSTIITDELTEQLKTNLLQSIIEEELWWQEAKKRKVKVTKEELQQQIQRYPAFQKNGVFDKNLYFSVLRYGIHMTPRQFEESVKRQIRVGKLKWFLVKNVVVTPQEVHDIYQKLYGSLEKFEEQKDQFRKSLLRQRQQQVLNSYLAELKNKATIINNFPLASPTTSPVF